MNKYLKLAKKENVCQKRKFMARLWKVFSGKKSIFLVNLHTKKLSKKQGFCKFFVAKKDFFFKMASFYDKIVLKCLFIGKF